MKMRYTSIRKVQNVIDDAPATTIMVIEDGYQHWVPARSIGNDSLMFRLKAAWMVFSGKADVLTYPEQ